MRIGHQLSVAVPVLGNTLLQERQMFPKLPAFPKQAKKACSSIHLARQLIYLWATVITFLYCLLMPLCVLNFHFDSLVPYPELGEMGH